MPALAVRPLPHDEVDRADQRRHDEEDQDQREVAIEGVARDRRHLANVWDGAVWEGGDQGNSGNRGPVG
eukprot:CAMPEP_0170319776 /NCGR_PEP_ID=MMETSP0116_2-20130129/60606_1 /TAXON_ID=400756 /ORGANISM="Durinskia baltica, Strain CSIRO CS-38" /LENGTH=68 /DNA_ID=CAMNT_0010572515 /DNA_START=51 /DNA_END=253 /DNA_ORIENTATION=-